MEARNVLITGLSGFVGNALVRAFYDDPGIRVYGHSRNVERSRLLYKDYNIDVVGDITGEMLDHLKIDTVIHLAGIAHDLSGRYKDSDYFAVNDMATRRVYDEFQRSGASKFIFLSSIKAVVDIAKDPVNEDVSPAPLSAYGRSKLQAEAYIKGRPALFGQQFFILRPCMVHGPGNKGNLNLLYKFVRLGFPFPLGKFNNQRSFLSVDNLTHVIRQCINGCVEPGIYHLADDGYLSTMELYNVIARTIGLKPRIWYIPKSFATALFSLLGRGATLRKLTEDMRVSNAKIRLQLKGPLPVTMISGIEKTIKSFNEH